MEKRNCLNCKFCNEISGCLICELKNQTINHIVKCPLEKYQFSNQLDFVKVGLYE